MAGRVDSRMSQLVRRIAVRLHVRAVAHVRATKLAVGPSDVAIAVADARVGGVGAPQSAAAGSAAGPRLARAGAEQADKQHRRHRCCHWHWHWQPRRQSPRGSADVRAARMAL